ncbi:ribbon-helix-helix domain-containing protein [Terricaulis silvestris]|uniref:Putative addiction module antidote protein, family n=1 Tax=Terricaulis silvestris TaxID=2686094 RepID=A0A6I6MUI4_9CAUL|nr:type II toxin-antitoxin system ParD family antitoxin [Terricaulis silvestris]QGZ96417.1 putative addiction module antidote protein, family [Terricaulis silvestris]
MSNSLTLPPDLAAKVQAHIDSGAATDPIEVVRAGLDALEAAEAAKLDAVRAKLARAMNDPRPSAPADDVFSRVEALINAAAKK